MLHVLLLTGAAAAAPTLGAWIDALGPPSADPAARARVRSADEPLLIYWMAAQAAPLGVGPSLPGTLVASFVAEAPLTDSTLQSATFLAVADPDQTRALIDAVRGAGWVQAESTEHRTGGTFHEYALTLPSGHATLAVRQGASAGAMADGRPAPSLWIYLEQESTQ